MPVVDSEGWSAIFRTEPKPAHHDYDAVPLKATVEGVTCYAVRRRGRITGLLVGSAYSPIPILASLREAVLVFSHMPLDFIDAIDEVLALSKESDS